MIERTKNEKGEDVLTFRVPIPDSVPPEQYEALAIIFEQKLNEALLKKMHSVYFE